MPLADFAAYQTALSTPSSINEKIYSGLSGASVFRWIDGYRAGPLADAIPSTAVVPTNADLGGLQQLNPSSGEQFLTSVRGAASSPCLVLLADRLSHQGGLNGTITSSQTTNLPTAALTRYTSGVGVFAAITIYTQLGTTNGGAQITYTNQAGTGGRVSTVVSTIIGGTGNREANRLLIMPLQAGDTGVRSVESVIIGTTGTAGNFGITLFKPLAAVFLPAFTNQVTAADIISGTLHGLLPKIENNACIFPIFSTMASVTVNASLNVLTEIV